ncbi:hypothetical protein HN511_06455, partial [bacterium]|nr:hypothetical protein [bacterium]
MFKVIAMQPENPLKTRTQLLTTIHSLESRKRRDYLVKQAIDNYFDYKWKKAHNKLIVNHSAHLTKKSLALINELIPPQYKQTLATLDPFITALENPGNRIPGIKIPSLMPYTKMVVLHIYHKTSIQGLLENLSPESDSDSSDASSLDSTQTSLDEDPLHTLERSASANPFADASAPGVDTFAGAAAKAMAAAMVAKRTATPAPRFHSKESLLQFKIFSNQFATYGPISITVRPGEKAKYETHIHTGDSKKSLKEKFDHYHKAFVSDPERSSSYTRM